MLLSEGSQGRQDKLLQSKAIYIQNISNGFQDMITFRIKIDNNISEGRVFYCFTTSSKLFFDILKKLKVQFDAKIVSAHRTPDRMYDFAKNAEKNYCVIIAGAGGSAHLPGMIASMTNLPVIGVPIESKKLKGLDSLLSIVQMPKGIPVGTVAIGEDGAFNAAILSASIVAISDNKVRSNLALWKKRQTSSVKKKPN